MASDLDEAYIRWANEGMSDPAKSKEISIAQMLDHGSISFGKYAVESLEWEKRSVFTHDRCQEELEKFKAPGLVAKKKAYFEEYYKKIRSLKGLSHEDQQTEITLDYGADGSIGSQTGEDDENSPHAKEPPVNVDVTCHSNCPAKISVGHGNGSSQDFGSEHLFSHSELASRCSNEIDLRRNSSVVSNLPCLDMNIGTSEVKDLEPSSSIISEVTHLDNFAGLSEKNMEDFCQKINSNDIPHIQQETYDCSMYDAGFKNGICRADLEKSSNSNNDLLTASEPCRFSQPTTVEVTVSTPIPSRSTAAPDEKLNQRKIPAKKSKKDTSKTETKECTISTANHAKQGDKIKENSIRSSSPARSLHMRRNSDQGRTVTSRKGRDITAPKDNKRGLFRLCKEKELRKDVTIPRPFSFATEKRVSTEKRPSTGVRGDTNEKVCSKTAIRPSVHGKDKLPSQNISKRPASSAGVRCMLSEKNRQQQSLPTKDLTDCQKNKIKRRDVITETSKVRCTIFPTSEKPRPNSRSGARVGSKVDEYKQKRQDDGRMCEHQPYPDPTTSTARKPNQEGGKMVPQQNNNLVADRSRPRQVVKRWR